MVGRWGLSSDIGPVAVLPPEAREPLFLGAASGSEDTQRRVDAEVRRIAEGAHDEVIALLRDHRSQLDALAEASVEDETLDEEAAYAAAGIEHPDEASAETLRTIPLVSGASRAS
jgi:cell division protease FtsH